MSDPWYKQLSRNALWQRSAGHMLAGYLWLVDRSARKVDSAPRPADHSVEADLPAIFTFWHGEHFMTALAVKRDWNMHVMISRSADGTINAIAAQALGLNVVRGAGDPKHRVTGKGHEKGGMSAFRSFARLLEDVASVAMTADVPKIARRVSPGLIRLARHSGRPILPCAYVTHPRITLKTWDRASLALPFAKAAVGAGMPIHIDDSRSEADWCQLVGQRLDALTDHSYGLCGGVSAFEPEGREEISNG